MLRKLLDGKILVEPLLEDRQKGFRLTGCLNVGRLLREDVYQALTRTELSQEERTSTAVVAPTGSAHGTVFLLGIRIEAIALAA